MHSLSLFLLLLIREECFYHRFVFLPFCCVLFCTWGVRGCVVMMTLMRRKAVFDVCLCDLFCDAMPMLQTRVGVPLANGRRRGLGELLL